MCGTAALSIFRWPLAGRERAADRELSNSFALRLEVSIPPPLLLLGCGAHIVESTEEIDTVEEDGLSWVSGLCVVSFEG